MISVAEATGIVLDHTADYGQETVSLAKAMGRILREPLVADRDFPPFTRVAMDGIAIRFDRYQLGQRTFPIEGTVAAGAEPVVLSSDNGCLEVMTGAVLPPGADTVIRYEDLVVKDGSATIRAAAVQCGQNAHPRGTERREGACIVPAGQVISPAEIGVAATVGKSKLQVARLPGCAIVYTGDELVEVDAKPLPHQIRASNAHTIESLLSRWQMPVDLLHLPDDKDQTRRLIEKCLENYELLILTGGISKGKFDFVPNALLESGVTPLFNKVAQRPGKPFWFGHRRNGPVVFALPGNPVSAFMCALRYLQPWVRKSLGLSAFDDNYARLTESVAFSKSQTYFLEVKTKMSKDSRQLAKPVYGKGSGDLANLTDADGFLELPPEEGSYQEGRSYRYFSYR